MKTSTQLEREWRDALISAFSKWPDFFEIKEEVERVNKIRDKYFEQKLQECQLQQRLEEVCATI